MTLTTFLALASHALAIAAFVAVLFAGAHLSQGAFEESFLAVLAAAALGGLAHAAREWNHTKDE